MRIARPPRPIWFGKIHDPAVPDWAPRPTVGRVLCYGKPLDGTINSHASVVFQTFALYPWLTVEQNVAVGLMAKRLADPN